MSKSSPIPNGAITEQVLIGGPNLKNGTCRCGYPLWMHDRVKTFDGEGRSYYRTKCPENGRVLNERPGMHKEYNKEAGDS